MDNIRIEELFKLPQHTQERYANLLKYLAPKAKLCGKDGRQLGDLTYAEVAKIKRLANDQDPLNVLAIVFNVSEPEILKVRCMEFFAALNWVQLELHILQEREKLLTEDVDPDLEEAGVKRLDVFKEFNVLIPLSKEYSLPPETIADWQYSTIFTILYHAKITNDIQRRHMEIQKSKR